MAMFGAMITCGRPGDAFRNIWPVVRQSGESSMTIIRGQRGVGAQSRGSHTQPAVASRRRRPPRPVLRRSLGLRRSVIDSVFTARIDERQRCHVGSFENQAGFLAMFVAAAYGSRNALRAT